MNDVVIKSGGHTIGAGIAHVNERKVYYTNYYKLLSEVYNEMTDSDVSFFDLISKYIESCQIDRIDEILDCCNKRINYMNSLKPPKSDELGAKWDGYTTD